MAGEEFVSNQVCKWLQGATIVSLSLSVGGPGGWLLGCRLQECMECQVRHRLKAARGDGER